MFKIFISETSGFLIIIKSPCSANGLIFVFFKLLSNVNVNNSKSKVSSDGDT